MYAIVRTGGKQYRVQAGDIIRVALLEKAQGEQFDMKEILFVGGEKKDYFGEPVLSTAKVTALVTKQEGKSKKIRVFKKKRRKGYRKTQGHRQLFTELFIKSISAPDGGSVSAEKPIPGSNGESVSVEKPIPESNGESVSVEKPIPGSNGESVSVEKP